MAGDPAYDLAQWLGNRLETAEPAADRVAGLRRQVLRFAEFLDLDPVRIAGWTFVKALAWEWGPPAASVWRAVLAAVAGD